MRSSFSRRIGNVGVGGGLERVFGREEDGESSDYNALQRIPSTRRIPRNYDLGRISVRRVHREHRVDAEEMSRVCTARPS